MSIIAYICPLSSAQLLRLVPYCKSLSLVPWVLWDYRRNAVLYCEFWLLKYLLRAEIDWLPNQTLRDTQCSENTLLEIKLLFAFVLV